MTKKIIMAAIVMLIALFFVGTASAGSVYIEPEGEPIVVTVGQDAFEDAGLAAVYEDMSEGSVYSVVVRRGDDNPLGEIVYSAPNSDGSQGPLPETPDYIEEVYWTPEDTNVYTMYATGASALGKRKISAQAPISPVPEMATIALTSAGLIGLVGLVRMRRKGGV